MNDPSIEGVMYDIEMLMYDIEMSYQRNCEEFDEYINDFENFIFALHGCNDLNDIFSLKLLTLENLIDEEFSKTDENLNTSTNSFNFHNPFNVFNLLNDELNFNDMQDHVQIEIDGFKLIDQFDEKIRFLNRKLENISISEKEIQLEIKNFYYEIKEYLNHAKKEVPSNGTYLLKYMFDVKEEVPSI